MSSHLESNHAQLLRTAEAILLDLDGIRMPGLAAVRGGETSRGRAAVQAEGVTVLLVRLAQVDRDVGVAVGLEGATGAGAGVAFISGVEVEEVAVQGCGTGESTGFTFGETPWRRC